MRHLVLPSASEGSTRLDVFPLAETVRWKGRLLPRYAWYMLSGAVCDVGQFLMYKTLWTSLGLPTFSWTAAYLLSIAMRQESHKVFVFGHYDGSWFKNLCRFYCVYFITVATSMPVNLVLVRLMACLPAQVLDFGIAQSTYVRRARGARRGASSSRGSRAARHSSHWLIAPPVCLAVRRPTLAPRSTRASSATCGSKPTGDGCAHPRGVQPAAAQHPRHPRTALERPSD